MAINISRHDSKRYYVTDDGKVINGATGKACKQWERNGYMCVRLYDGERWKNEYVHRLIAKAFIPNPNKLPCVNHVDGVKTNNVADNLEWCTWGENTLHRYYRIDDGTGEGGGRRRPILCVETGETFRSVKECERITGIKSSALHECLSGRNKTCAKKHWEYVFKFNK